MKKARPPALHSDLALHRFCNWSQYFRLIVAAALLFQRSEGNPIFCFLRLNIGKKKAQPIRATLHQYMKNLTAKTTLLMPRTIASHRRG